MITERSRFDRFDAALEDLKREAEIDRELPALPTHHLGCVLAPDHDGDCVVHRARSRTVRLVGSALVVALAVLTGCAARVDPQPAPEPTPAPAPTPSAVPYNVSRCADYTGYSALIGATCEPGDVTLSVGCSADAGKVNVSQGFRDNGWQCGAIWDDSKAGGRLCVRFMCGAPVPSR